MASANTPNSGWSYARERQSLSKISNPLLAIHTDRNSEFGRNVRWLMGMRGVKFDEPSKPSVPTPTETKSQDPQGPKDGKPTEKTAGGGQQKANPTKDAASGKTTAAI